MSVKKEEVLTLNEILAIMQREFKSKKSRFNAFGKYNFRSAEDILEALKPFIEKYKVTVNISESLMTEGFDHGMPIMVSTATISNDSHSISANAIVGVDMAQKGMQTPQKFGSASSYGKKYALGNLFLIDDTQDSDATNGHKPAKAKPKLEGDAIQKAKDFISSGKGTLDQIKAKYNVSDVVLKQLTA